MLVPYYWVFSVHQYVQFFTMIPNPWSFVIDCVFISPVFVQLFIPCILSICITTCWTRYCIHCIYIVVARNNWQIAKSLRQTDTHSHPSHIFCLLRNVTIGWSQNNQVKFDTRDCFQRYLTNVFPNGSYFVVGERSEMSFLGSIFELWAPTPPFGTKYNAVMVVFF